MNADDIIPIDTGARHARVSVQDIRDDERLQTQRRMIAALYWRAGALACESDEQFTLAENLALLDEAACVEDAARAMEAAL